MSNYILSQHIKVLWHCRTCHKHGKVPAVVDVLPLILILKPTPPNESDCLNYSQRSKSESLTPCFKGGMVVAALYEAVRVSNAIGLVERSLVA